jgi:hypothetical protein
MVGTMAPATVTVAAAHRCQANIDRLPVNTKAARRNQVNGSLNGAVLGTPTNAAAARAT